MLVLDAGDYSMGTAFGAATREIGGELQLMSRMGYDATTFGNHEFDLGPDGLGKSIGVAAKAGRVPAVVASNTNFSKARRDAGRSPAPGQGRGDPPPPRDRARRHSLRHLRSARQGGPVLHQRRGCGDLLRRHRDRQGDGEGSPRDGEGGCGHRVSATAAWRKGKDGRFSEGDDVRLAKAVPGIDVVIGGHSHTELQEAIIVNGRTPVVQTGKESQNLGELVVTLDGGKLTVESYRLYPIDDTIAGDRAIADEIDKLKKRSPRPCSRRAATASISRWPLRRGTCPTRSPTSPPARSSPTSVTDAFRKATKADIGFTANGTDARRPHPGEVRRANRL